MFFFNVGQYIIFIYISFYVCVCACVFECVRACMPGDITLLTAEMGFLESVFEDYSRPLSSNNITLTVATESDVSIRQTSC